MFTGIFRSSARDNILMCVKDGMTENTRIMIIASLGKKYVLQQVKKCAILKIKNEERRK